MSITFFCPDAPCATKDVDYGGEVVCEKVSSLPEVNLSNATAKAVLDVLGLECSAWGGEVAGARLDEAIRAATLVVNGTEIEGSVVEPSEGRGPMRIIEREGKVTWIGGGARWIDMGVSEERIRSRVSELLLLFTQAKRNGFAVCWG
jgi:hypothetical protein